MAIKPDVDALLSPQTAFSLTTTELALRLRDTAAACSIEDVRDITARLLDDVHSGAVPPSFFRLWLPLAARRAPSLIKTALLDRHSHGVRLTGITTLKLALTSERWKEDGWDAVGGVRGLAEVLESLSLDQVRTLVHAIRKCNRAGDASKGEAVDELVRLLMPTLLPSSTSTASPPRDSTRQRFLFAELAPLLPACSTELLLEVFSKPLPESFEKRPLYRALTQSHLNLMRGIATGAVKVHQDVRVETIQECGKRLILSPEPYESRDSNSGISPGVSPGIRLFIDIITSELDPPGSKKYQLFCEPIRRATDLALRRKFDPKDLSILFDVIISATERWGREIAPMQMSYEADYYFTSDVMRYLITAAFWKGDIVAWPVSKQKRRRARRSRLDPDQTPNFESLLIRILSISRPHIMSGEAGTIMKQLFEQDVPPEVMLPFIKAYFRYHRAIKVDLETETTPQQRCIKHFGLLAETLFQLPPDDAKWLFDRTKSLAGLDKAFAFARASGALRRLNSEKQMLELEQILHIMWEAQGALSIGKGRAEKLLPDAKRKAERGSDATARCDSALYCVDIAVSSGSVELVGDVLVWARRFLRDPVAGPDIYKYITSSGASDVLSCTRLLPHQRPKARSELVSLVDRANEILFFHLETSHLALREPGARYDQAQTEGLVRSVSFIRADAIPMISKSGIASEKDLVNILLTSLEPLLLTCEGISLRETRKAAKWTSFLGPIGPQTSHRHPLDYELPFWDQLARKRDQLWIEERIEREPKVIDLEDGWPRGLPLHYLVPDSEWAAAAVRNEKLAPFVASRVKEVVFCDKELALSTVSEVGKVAIGLFCDSLKYAMQAYIGFTEPQSERRSRLLEIWYHYSGPEWRNRSHVESVYKFLVDFAKMHDINLSQTVLHQEEQPIIHCYENVLGPTKGPVEWDPRPKQRDQVKSVVNSSDQALCTLLRCRFWADDASKFMAKPVCVEPREWEAAPPDNEGTFFRLGRLGLNLKKLPRWSRRAKPGFDLMKLPFSIREAIIASAILFLDTNFAAGSPRLLSKPFPENSVRVRYPSLYLDYDFLASVRCNAAQDAVRFLEALLKSVPSNLLHALARSMLNAVVKEPRDSNRYATLLSTTMDVIKLLPHSDNPDLAVDIAMDVVRQLPNDSSWYWHVASTLVALRVNPISAERMASSLSSIVLDGLEKQKLYRKYQSSAEPEAAGKTATDTTTTVPFVKISTIKMLAQLLSGCSAFSLHTDLSILKSLFVASKQIDVRRNVIEGVLNLLKWSIDMEPEVTDKIYATFKSFVGVAAGPSERVTVSEDAWLDAEAGGPLPEVGTDTDLTEIFIRSAKFWLPERFRASYVRGSIIPLIEESTKQHNRWMRIFLNRMDLNPDEASVTDFGPFNKDLVEDVFEEWADYLPREYLLLRRTWALRYIDILKLQNIPDRLDKQREGWTGSNEGIHVSELLRSETPPEPLERLAILMLDPAWKSNIPDGITREQLIEEYYTCSTLIIDNPIVGFKDSTPVIGTEHFELVSLPLRNRYLGHSTSPEVREKYIPELWRRIISYIESRRNDSWAKDPLSNPLILPPSISLDTFLLPYPHLHDSDPRRYEVFAESLRGLVDRCASSTCCEFDYVALEGCLDHVYGVDLVRCALEIGKLGDEDHTRPQGYMKVRLALRLLRRAAESSNLKNSDVVGLFDSWKVSPSEGIRITAWNWQSQRYNGKIGH